MTSKRRSLINLLSLSYLSKSISKSLLINIFILSFNCLPERNYFSTSMYQKVDVSFIFKWLEI